MCFEIFTQALKSSGDFVIDTSYWYFRNVLGKQGWCMSGLSQLATRMGFEPTTAYGLCVSMRAGQITK